MKAALLGYRRSDTLGDPKNAVQIQVALFCGRGADTDEADLGLENSGFGIESRGYLPFQPLGFDDPSQVLFDDGRPAPIDQVDFALADIDADNHVAALSETGQAHTPDISQAKDADAQSTPQILSWPFSAL
jgi:hypothetical protein